MKELFLHTHDRLAYHKFMHIWRLILAALLAVCFAVQAGETPAGMVHVPAGPFTMGRGNSPPLGPERRVTLKVFFIDRTEVTVGAYKACAAAEACQWNPNADSPRFFRDDQPMALVNWHDANAYCRFVDKRLPTEAEWEKAARGTDGRAYPWGEEQQANRANVLEVSAAPVDLADYRFTWPVGSATGDVSPYGAFDLAGNVAEWTADLYRADYHRSTPAADPAVTTDKPDPEGRLARTVRGGSFAGYASEAAAYRRDGRRHAAGRGLRLGFRCAKDADQ